MIFIEEVELTLYEPIDAQDYLGVSYGTLNRYRREGYLKGHLVGQVYLYEKQQLDQCLEALGRNRQDKNVEVIYGKPEGS